MFFICQSMGDFTSEMSVSFVFEKWRQPKNPRDAESGLGCAAVKMKWRDLSISSALDCA